MFRTSHLERRFVRWMASVGRRLTVVAVVVAAGLLAAFVAVTILEGDDTTLQAVLEVAATVAGVAAALITGSWDWARTFGDARAADALFELSLARRARLGRQVRRGQAVDDPHDAALASALAKGWRLYITDGWTFRALPFLAALGLVYGGFEVARGRPVAFVATTHWVMSLLMLITWWWARSRLVPRLRAAEFAQP